VEPGDVLVYYEEILLYTAA